MSLVVTDVLWVLETRGRTFAANGCVGEGPQRVGAYRLFDRIAAKRNTGGVELLISARVSMEPNLQFGLRSQDVSIM
jgi:hypothetical protein